MRKAPLLTKMKNREASVLLEVLLATAVLGLVALAVGGIGVISGQGSVIAGRHGIAINLAEESIAAVRNIRDDNFALLVDGTYGLTINGGVWELSGSQDVVGQYTRTVNVSTISANVRQITASVTWPATDQRTGQISAVTYLSDWAREIIANPWVTPVVEGSDNISGNQNGLALDVQGNFVYLVRDGGTPDFIIYDVSDTANPTIVSSLSLDGNPTDIDVDGDYAYVASTQNNAELQIINISNPSSPSLAGQLNLNRNSDALGLRKEGNYIYLIRATDNKEDEIYSINVIVPAVPVVVSSINRGVTHTDIFVLGSEAYITSTTNNEELAVVDISTPALISISTTYDLTGNSDGTALWGEGANLFVGRANGDTTIYDATIPAALSEESTYSSGDEITGISSDLSQDFVFLSTDSNPTSVEVLDVSTITAPIQHGVFALPGGGIAEDLFYSSSFDRIFLATTENAQELVILSPN